MPRSVAERVVELLAASPSVEVLDLTGGAPELNPSFRWLVAATRRLGRTVVDRCNLTVLLLEGMDDLAAFLAAHQVHVVASLPCHRAENVEEQRGRGSFEGSIEALLRLNALGYGRAGSGLRPHVPVPPEHRMGRPALRLRFQPDARRGSRRPDGSAPHRHLGRGRSRGPGRNQGEHGLSLLRIYGGSRLDLFGGPPVRGGKGRVQPPRRIPT